VTDFDPRTPEYFSDPHPMLRRLRREDPVHRSPLGFWVLTRYEDVVAGLRSPMLGASRTAEQFRALYGGGPTFAFASRRFQYFDPPEHTRVRSLVVKAFTLRRVEAMRPRIAAIAERLLDRLEGRRSFELIGQVAHPLPAIVICEMLGVPEAEQAQLSDWAGTIPFIIAPVIDPGRLAAADAALGEFMAYVGELIERRRKEPGDDLLSALMAAEEGGDRLSREEIMATVIFLFSAGHHTTRSLVGNGILTLLRDPELWARLAATPDLVPGAVEECLRYEPSINFAPRRARADAMFGGKRIPEGDLVFLSLPGANRDPERFAEPDRFDIGRQRNDHVAFGGGIHHCLGASLARAEVQILMAGLLRRFPRLSLGPEPVAWRPTMTYRGLEALHVEVA
jgi:cytochrome P450